MFVVSVIAMLKLYVVLLLGCLIKFFFVVVLNVAFVETIVQEIVVNVLILILLFIIFNCCAETTVI